MDKRMDVSNAYAMQDLYSPSAEPGKPGGRDLSSVHMGAGKDELDQSFGALARAKPGGPPGGPQPGGDQQGPLSYQKLLGNMLNRYDWSRRLLRV